MISTGLIEDDEDTTVIKKELCEKVAAYYNKLYDTDEFVAFEHECDTRENGYFLILRSQGGNSANTLVTGVYVNITTGEVTDDFNNSWNLYEL